jgi:hypothetical protein
VLIGVCTRRWLVEKAIKNNDFNLAGLMRGDYPNSGIADIYFVHVNICCYFFVNIISPPLVK